ncbi:MAG: putative acetyltransferase [Syntrophorhabdus sp. PtaU1.Bin002]|nr:MAG: putative acetyltransferase [Syntrophorhabdus sp. PtaU1.Bin002]
MTEKQAEQIAELLNKQNQLTRKYDRNDILQRRDCFVTEVDVSGDVLGAVEVEKIQWYQAEIKHLSVAENQQGRGLGRDLLSRAERKAIDAGARIAQCTIRDNNTASIKLFLSSGYKHTLTFVNQDTRNRVMIMQKLIQ